MLHFFPEPYDDEMFFSIIGRYHYYSGNEYPSDTCIDLFGTPHIRPSLEFPSRLADFAEKLPNKSSYSCDYFIGHHTLYPFYEPFLSEERKLELLDKIKYKIDSASFYRNLGITRWTPGFNVMYCPKCAVEDEETREVYFHRSHQIRGISVCYKHGCLLKNYPIINEERRLANAFTRMEFNQVETDAFYEHNNYYNEQFKRLAQLAYDLIYNYPLGLTNNIIFKKYLNLLKKKQLLRVGGLVKQEDLHRRFSEHYPNDFLERLGCKLKGNTRTTWLARITRPVQHMTFPLKHLLLINFLCQDSQEFFQPDIDVLPFGEGPWYCLNPVADHYQKRVVTDCKVTFNYAKKEPLGTFTCKCGFSYTRNASDDEMKCRLIKSFGQLWEKKLEQLLRDGAGGLKEISRKMSCDSKTILKYAKKLGLSGLISSNSKYFKSLCDVKSIDMLDYREKYRDKILEVIAKNPNMGRSQIYKCIPAECYWLWKHDREWMNDTLPSKQKSSGGDGWKYIMVDWMERDKEYLKRLQNEYERLIKDANISKITKTKLAGLLGKREMSIILDKKNANKLPNTIKFLTEVTETPYQYLLRKIDCTCVKLFKEKGSFSANEVLILASFWLVPGALKDQIKERINLNLEKLLLETKQL